jgi:hypothetical protein
MIRVQRKRSDNPQIEGRTEEKENNNNNNNTQ